MPVEVQSVPEPHAVFGRQVRGSRQRRHWSQQVLADLVNEATGWNWKQTTVGKVENGTRAVTVEEMLVVAAILGVAPVHLLTPREDDDEFLFAGLSMRAPVARAWMRGEEPLPGQNRRFFFSEVPDSEFTAPQHTSAADMRAFFERSGGEVRHTPKPEED